MTCAATLSTEMVDGSSSDAATGDMMDGPGGVYHADGRLKRQNATSRFFSPSPDKGSDPSPAGPMSRLHVQEP
jgi:hypothetical protein